MKKIDLEKCVGIWLDHEKAYFIRPGKPGTIEKVESDIESHQRTSGETSTGMRLGNNRSTNNEYSLHTKKQEQIKQYYKLLFSKLKPYDHIVLFGSSTAKNEFGNFISEQKPLHAKIVEIKPAKEMTENEMSVKVSEYFDEVNTIKG